MILCDGYYDCNIADMHHNIFCLISINKRSDSDMIRYILRYYHETSHSMRDKMIEFCKKYRPEILEKIDKLIVLG